MHPITRAVASASLLLLGTEHPPPELDQTLLKKAYRRMALLAHPDTRTRAAAPDFLRVRQAYDLLLLFLEKGRVLRPETPRTPKSWYWTGGMPARELRLGEFLFFAGAIPWDVLIRSISEQRIARPSLGKLAQSSGLATPQTVALALAKRKPGERLGEAMIRLGLVGPRAMATLLEEQRRLQRPLGWHLVRLGHVPQAEIPALLVKFWRHNGGVQAAARRRKAP